MRRTCNYTELTDTQLDWYNDGIALLFAVMSGRDVDDAAKSVFMKWRVRGHIISPTSIDTQISTCYKYT